MTTAKSSPGKPQEPKMLSVAAMTRAPFAEVLASARRNALTVTHKGKPVAVLLSTSRYRRMLRAISALMEEAEDREWAEKARRAKKQGFVSRAESDALMRELGAARQKHGG
ncbi:MAG: type II toxin-antitoxin system prevent-host-death family antitoxin [Gammaproteobacteria bacterium]